MERQLERILRSKSHAFSNTPRRRDVRESHRISSVTTCFVASTSACLTIYFPKVGIHVLTRARGECGSLIVNHEEQNPTGPVSMGLETRNGSAKKANKTPAVEGTFFGTWGFIWPATRKALRAMCKPLRRGRLKPQHADLAPSACATICVRTDGNNPRSYLASQLNILL